MEENAKLIQTLQSKDLYPHPVESFQIIETHLSWVILTGPYAYKIKKAINLGFADFSTLEKRKFYCQEEVRLNKRLSEALEYELVAILGTADHPRLHFPEFETIPVQMDREDEDRKDQALPPIEIEYAVRMKQFDQNQLLSALAKKGSLTLDHIHHVAAQVASFHAHLIPDQIHDRFGSAALIQQSMLDNFTSCQQLLKKIIMRGKHETFNDNDENESLNDADESQNHRHASLNSGHEPLRSVQEILNQLEQWSLTEFEQCEATFAERKKNGFIRECHGDLHLGNMVAFNNQVIIFDCIEFNPDFRWIDIIADIAFLTMDLHIQAGQAQSFAFLNTYLELMGDYEGLKLLCFNMVYRAMVRAKVALLTPHTNSVEQFKRYLTFAQQFIQKTTPKLIITFGVSGSGKTTLARSLAPLLQAIHLRSDIERKRFKKEVAYTPEHILKVYQALWAISKKVLELGYSVFVDATFLKREHRLMFLELAQELQLPFIILHCVAPLKLLHRRVFERAQQKQDASEADLHVLNEQFSKLEPESDIEKTHTLVIQTDTDMNIEALVKHSIFE